MKREFDMQENLKSQKIIDPTHEIIAIKKKSTVKLDAANKLNGTCATDVVRCNYNRVLLFQVNKSNTPFPGYNTTPSFTNSAYDVPNPIEVCRRPRVVVRLYCL